MAFICCCFFAIIIITYFYVCLYFFNSFYLVFQLSLAQLALVNRIIVAKVNVIVAIVVVIAYLGALRFTLAMMAHTHTAHAHWLEQNNADLEVYSLISVLSLLQLTFFSILTFKYTFD